MFADALWTLAMAVNAYLVIFRKYDIEDLKRLEKWYLLVCYGLPFIPAFAFCFVDDGSKGRMFGSATVSISLSHTFIRILQLTVSRSGVGSRLSGESRVSSLSIFGFGTFLPLSKRFSITNC